MSVLKRNSVYFGGGVDISNSIELPKPQTHTAAAADPGAVERLPEPAPDPEQELLEQKRRLEQRMSELDQRERDLEQERKSLEEMKARCVEQGKEVILEAKRRAESIVSAANDNASQIISDAEANRDSVFIRAKSEGFEQGQKDGREACQIGRAHV